MNGPAPACSHDDGILHLGQTDGEPIPGYHAVTTFGKCMSCDAIITGTWVYGSNGAMSSGFHTLVLEKYPSREQTP